MHDLTIQDKKQKAILLSINPNYHREAVQFLSSVERTGITAESVSKYITELNTRGYSASTTNKHYAAIKHILRKMLDSPDMTNIQKWTIDKFVSGIKSKKVGKGEKVITADKILSEAELEIMIEKSPSRTSLIIEFLYYTGCRISETLNIKLTDVKKENNGLVHFRILGKGKKERTIKVAKDLVNRILECFQGNTYLFETGTGNKLHDRNVAKDLRRLGNNHIGRPVNPHMLRHTRASQLIKKTGKIKAVSEYLGHSTTAITLDMYCHEYLEDEDLTVSGG
jgi:integrase/recombinase XerD